MHYSLIFFFLSLILSVFLLNFLVYFPVAKAYKLDRRIRSYLLLGLSFLTFVMFGGEIARRLWDIYWLSVIGYIWLGILSISFTIMLLNMIIYFVYRRIFRSTTTLSLFLIVILSLLALINNLQSPSVREYDIFSDKISQDTDEFRLVLVSEFHLTRNNRTKWLTGVVERINSLEPDAVVIAGDLIDDPFAKVSHFAPVFRLLTPTYGVYSVPGNHDYYQDINSYYQFTSEAGLINLLNDNKQITPALTFAGVTDKTAERQDLEPPDVTKAFKGIDQDSFIVFISHQPLYSEEATALGSDLILAGHTHRGQIPPMLFIVELFFRYPYGLYEEKGSIIYTTSGISTWGPPMRLFSRNEIVVFSVSGKVK